MNNTQRHDKYVTTVKAIIQEATNKKPRFTIEVVKIWEKNVLLKVGVSDGAEFLVIFGEATLTEGNTLQLEGIEFDFNKQIEIT